MAQARALGMLLLGTMTLASCVAPSHGGLYDSVADREVVRLLDQNNFDATVQNQPDTWLVEVSLSRSDSSLTRGFNVLNRSKAGTSGHEADTRR